MKFRNYAPIKPIKRMNTLATIQFLGAAGVVTGSKTLISTEEQKILIDCGMFQGLKELRERNWKNLPVEVPSIDVVLLTHGHLDHVGYLPRLVLQGFTGRIIGTAPTLAVAEIILRDSARIHEEEAKRANEENYSKHHPALPFYTAVDAEKTIQQFEVSTADTWHQLSENSSYRMQSNGHIIGSVFLELKINGRVLVFSGDIGRKNDLLLSDPKKPEWADYLFIESTYGNKLHAEEDIETILIELVKETIQKKGTLIIPSFAVERLQTVMYILWDLYKKNKIPNIPIFVDSPMGNNVLEVFNRFPNWHKLPMAEYHAMCRHINIIESYKETWETIDDTRAKIVIAGSGMVTGGRVLTYLKQLIDKSSTTILLVGYQAEGTRGRQLQEGAHEIRFYGKYYPVKATVKNIESLSAHGDQQDLLDWMSSLKNIPEQVFLMHGEPNALDTFRVKIKENLHYNVSIPKLYDIVDL